MNNSVLVLGELLKRGTGFPVLPGGGSSCYTSCLYMWRDGFWKWALPAFFYVRMVHPLAAEERKRVGFNRFL